MSKLEESTNHGAHYQLSRLVGEWEGTTRVWFDPSKVEDESPVRGTMRLILNNTYVLHEYEGSFAGKPLSGLAVYAYHIDLQRYQCAWIDSFHTGSAIMFSEGQRGQEHMNVLGNYAYVTPDMEQYWGWRTQIEVTDDNTIIMTAFNVSPDGEETKATETVYKRVG